MISDILKKIFGDKSTKDQKRYQPFVDQTTAYLTEIQGLSDDQLRQKSFEFRKKIQAAIQQQELEVEQIQEQIADVSRSVNEKEALFEQIDALTKAIDETIEEVLLEILPEAFAVVKETAHRWVTNGQLKVEATVLDRYLAKKKV